MPSPTTVYLAPRQKKRLFARAKKRGTSFSGELRAAVELYLEFPPDEDLRDLEAVAREANASLDRSNAKLDEAIARAKLTVKKLEGIDRRLDELVQDSL